MTRRRLAALVLLCLALPPAARAADPDSSVADGSAQAALNAAEARWAALGVDSYRFTAQRTNCLCVAPAPFAFVVKDGTAVNADAGEAGLSTVPLLFSRIQSLITAGAQQFRAAYDPTTGIPTEFFGDATPEIADDQTSFSAGAFHVPDPGITDGSAAADLAAARARWRALHLRTYSYHLAFSCACGTGNGAGRWLFHVRRGRPYHARPNAQAFMTVPRLFALIAEDIDGVVPTLQVRYGATGMPRVIAYDVGVGDGSGTVTVSGLRPHKR